MNAYTITWAILTPIKGKVTKKDLTAIRRSAFTAFERNGEVFFDAPNKDRATIKAKNIAGLSKDYEVVFITDKQFGMSNYKESLKVQATKKQLLDRFFIYKTIPQRRIFKPVLVY